MHHLSRIVVLLLLVCATASAATDPTYDAIRTSRPDSRTIALSDFTFERDVYKVKLTGTLHLLKPADGHTFGAVFIGNGSYELTPASDTERRQLALVTRKENLQSLTDAFEQAVFFSSELVDAAAKAGTAGEASAPNAASLYDEYLKRQRKDLTTNIHIRIAQELINKHQPFFFGWVKGKTYPPAILSVDPLGADEMRLAGIDDGGEQTMMLVYDQEKAGVWYLSRLRSELQSGRGATAMPLADAEHYTIDLDVVSRDEVAGTTTITLTTPYDGLRLLPVSLMSRLRVSEASFAPAGEAPQWTPVAFVQEQEKEDGDFAVVFPEALQKGAKYLLRVTYKGKDVLFDAGDGNYSVGARTSWYANVGTFTDLATYDMTFRVPQKLQVVATGVQTGEKVEGDKRVSTWKSESPIRVAGFNYGKFKKLSNTDRDSGMTVDVYTNPGTPDIINQINGYLEAAAEEEGGPRFVKVDTGKLAQAAMADGINTARTGNIYFGELPVKQVAITQQSQWAFGQSWPSLIYMPYIAFLSGTTRNTLGLNSAKDFVEEVGPHEFAHQWWGHHVGWKSYHDQWLSEGFAEFTAALVLQQTNGYARYDDFFERARRRILETPRYATISNTEAGPIWLGQRVSTWRNRDAYAALIYAKGAYVLHMLRTLMQDRSNPQNTDVHFMEMMKDFATTWEGRNPSTADFQQIVEKHWPQNVRITSDGKLDWFFNQWVYGTDIPKFETKLTVTDAGNGKYKLAGTITQSQVNPNFVSLVPLYVNFDKGSFAQVGTIPVIGNATKEVNAELALPKPPKSLSINNRHDILAR